MAATKAFSRSDAVKRSLPLPQRPPYSTIMVHARHIGWRSGEFALLCPMCGFNCTHHEKVTVYGRAEDETTVAEVEVVGRVTKLRCVPSKESRNPSSRRDGLSVKFWCEGCGKRFELTIEQHKGETYLAWR